MAFTYTGDPAGSNRDKVRFLIQDTIAANALLQDEEIAYLLTTWGNNVYEAAIAAAELIAGQFARKTNYSRSIGDLSISESFATSASEYHILAQKLRQQKDTLFPPSPIINAQSIKNTKDKVVETYKSDFYTGLMDYNV
jgi:hypothetical protein